MKRGVSVSGSWKEGENLQRSPKNFHFHPRNHRKLQSLKTVTGNKKCVSCWSITHSRPSQAPVTLVLSLLDMKSTDFIVGKFLDTTNTVRLSVLMFSWQPLLSLLILQFIYSARLRSKLNGKKHSHIVLRNCLCTDCKRREQSYSGK